MRNAFKRPILFAALCVTAGFANAQTWPTKPVTIVVPFPAGGTTDVLARAVSVKLSSSIGQPVIVDNRPGAGATLGAELVAKAPADGHTLLMGAVHHTVWVKELVSAITSFTRRPSSGAHDFPACAVFYWPIGSQVVLKQTRRSGINASEGGCSIC